MPRSAHVRAPLYQSVGLLLHHSIILSSPFRMPTYPRTLNNTHVDRSFST
jgi:hypothetical protein